jgi:adenine-specific DNA-methyltransferase
LDAQQLAQDAECEIAYIDPPYNGHPYGSNYHLLNTVALWDKPHVERAIILDGRSVNKSAIRKDWRTERRSAYNYPSQALDALSKLVFSIKAKYILVSYSSDGIIPLDSLVSAFGERGEVTSVSQSYKRYRVSAQRYSHQSHTIETVWIIRCV